jgi:hypothetical protein
LTEPTVVFTEVEYSITFSESGLAPGTPWSVTLNGTLESSMTNSITFTEPNGTYPYAIGGVAGSHQSTLAYFGVVTVNGLDITEPSLSFTPFEFSVTFSETGLRPGSTWTVTLNGTSETSASGSIRFLESNGTYAYSIPGVPGWMEGTLAYAGSVTVDGAAVVEPGIVFTQVEYDVTFAESGLPNLTPWSISLNGSVTHSTGGQITFTVPNGSYAYVIGSVAGWQQSTLPGSGTVVINGSAVVEAPIAYSPVEYSVTFTETGLTAGTNWSVTFNGTVSWSTTTTISWSVPNGTYSFTVGAVGGYSVNRSSGTAVVNGSALSQSVAFSASNSPLSGSPILGYALIALAVVVIALGAVWASRRRNTTDSSRPAANDPPA